MHNVEGEPIHHSSGFIPSGPSNVDVHWIPTPSVLSRDSVLPIKKKGTFAPWSCFSCFWSRFKVIRSVYKLPQSEGNLPWAEAAQVAATPDSLLTPMVGPAAAAWVPQALELPEVGTDGHPWVKAIRELLVETSTSWDLRILNSELRWVLHFPRILTNQW